MSLDPVWFFVVLGLALIASEAVLPGLVVSFLGASALLVAAAMALGLVHGWVNALTAWCVVSLVAVLGIRNLFTRLLPGSAIKQLTDQDVDAFGEVVEVVAPVGTEPGGRIRFRGTTWAAQTVQDDLPPGTKARIVARDNLVWIVEPLDGWAALAAGPEPAEKESS